MPTFLLLQLTRPLGPPHRPGFGPPGHGDGRPFPNLGDPGPQYLLGIAVWCLALLLVRTSVRDDDARSRYRLLTIGFAAGLMRDVFSLGLEFLGPKPLRASMLHPGVLPAIEAWAPSAALIVLIAGFLAYLADNPSIGSRYLKIALPLYSAAFAVVVAILLAFTGPRAVGLRRDQVVMALIALGFCIIAAGLGLTLQGVKRNPERWIMAASITSFLASIGVMSMAYFDAPWAIRPPMDVPYAVTTATIGVVMLGYLFVRAHSAEVQADIDVLEEQVRQRTSHLEAALEELAVANSKLIEQSTIDGLTGAYNRRFFDDALQEEWARAGRLGAPVALALIDLDKFKQINDQYGHPKGDECLLCLAAVLQGRLRRPGDIVARYGGDEFVVLLPNTSEEDAATVLERLRKGIEDLDSPPAPGMTVSVGVAGCIPAAGEDPESLLHRADERLYAAKQDGRNCVRAGDAAISEIA